MVGMHINPVELYSAEDRSLLVWISAVVERIHETQERAAKER